MNRQLLQTYINQIRQYPLLTAEQEGELADKASHGDRKAFDTLVNSNLRLVISVAKKYHNPRIGLLDIIQEGNLGLIAAAEKYRTSFHTRFSTYAYLWISQAISRYVQNKQSLIMIPHRKENLLRKITAARDYLINLSGKNPSEEELASFMGLPREEIKEVLKYHYSMSSLDMEINENIDTSIGDLIQDTTYSPDKEILKESYCQLIVEILDKLPLQERTVIFYRYNLGYDESAKTLREVGDMLGVSQETVRQIEKRALKRLRALMGQENLCIA